MFWSFFSPSCLPTKDELVSLSSATSCGPQEPSCGPHFCRHVAHSILYHIALGSNLGDRLAHLQAGVQGIGALADTRLLSVSSVWETAAHLLPGNPPQPAYFNAVLGCKTPIAPDIMLQHLLEIERMNGRQRDTDEAWQPRTLDLDILSAGSQRVDSENLTLPHPRLGQRRFVLEPFAEIAPRAFLPSPFEATVAYLLSICDDVSSVVRTPHSLQLLAS